MKRGKEGKKKARLKGSVGEAVGGTCGGGCVVSPARGDKSGKNVSGSIMKAQVRMTSSADSGKQVRAGNEREDSMMRSDGRSEV